MRCQLNEWKTNHVVCGYSYFGSGACNCLRWFCVTRASTNRLRKIQKICCWTLWKRMWFCRHDLWWNSDCSNQHERDQPQAIFLHMYGLLENSTRELHSSHTLTKTRYPFNYCPRSSVDRASVSGTAGRMFDSCRGHLHVTIPPASLHLVQQVP